MRPEDLTKEEKVALIKVAFPDYPGDQSDYSFCDRCPTFASCDENIHDPPFPCHELKVELCSLIENLDKGPKLSLHMDGWWIHFSGKEGKAADLYLGAKYEPIVESVLRDNLKAEMRVKEKEGGDD